MLTPRKHILYIGLLGLLLLPGLTLADGLSDLNNALHRLQGSSKISAKLDSSSVDIKGEGDKKIYTNGQVIVMLEDDEHGLRVHYSKEVLEKMTQEALIKAQDEEAETKTLTAIDAITASELQNMLSGSSALLRILNQAEFLQEEHTDLHGSQARLLSFRLPIEYFIKDKEVRSYVSKFKAEYLIWIAADGTPLESRIKFSGHGRVFFFFKIAVTGTAFSRYQVFGERLLVVHKETSYLNDTSLGVFEHSERKTLQIQHRGTE